MAVYGNYPNLSNVKKILVVKLRHLGDVLLTGPVFFALEEMIPGATIDAYIYKEAFPILEGHPKINRLIGYDRLWKNLPWFLRMRQELVLLWTLRKEKYDLVINLTEGDRGILTSLVSGAKIRAGFRPKGKWQARILTHIAKNCPTLLHTVEKNLDVCRKIGIFPSAEAKELFFLISNEAMEKVRILTGKKPYILIHPTSRWLFKCWPVLKMRRLVAELLQEGKQIVLTSGPDPKEREMANEIARESNVLNLSGAISLRELGALIEQSECLVCVDSVPFHIASALKKPVVALFGPTSEVTWGPWKNPHARIVSLEKSCRPCYLDGCGGSKRSDCLESLPVAFVLREIHQLQLIPFPKNKDTFQLRESLANYRS